MIHRFVGGKMSLKEVELRPGCFIFPLRRVRL
jgi:hypothetical protein